MNVIETDDLDICPAFENKDVCDAGMDVIETDDLEICPVFENAIDDENSIPALTICDHDGDTAANRGDDDDIVGKGDAFQIYYVAHATSI